MKIENLNKENFWNSLYLNYPTAVQYFCNWIDEYKKSVEWQNLFKQDVKFHDIPLEMQNGIIARFELELFNNKEGEGKKKYIEISQAYKNEVANLFKDLQTNLINRSIPNN